ncbi:MAG: lamin tail domain-containing protein [Polyangiaceae bacterium]
MVQRFLSNSSGAGSDEWYAVTNVSPGPLALGGYKLGDEETPDGNEGMFAFPAAMLAGGATFTVARSGSAYQAYFGKAPDAEMPPGASMAVPDMIADATWTTAAMPNMQLNNAGDEVLVLDRSSTIVDIAVFGNGAYSGVLPFTPAPGIDDVISRDAMGSDTDDCSVDFANVGQTCVADNQCGGACFECKNNACAPKPMGSACPDANPCDGDEICNGQGACVSNPAPICDDGNPCTNDGCTPATGCTHMPSPTALRAATATCATATRSASPAPATPASR